MLLSLYAAIAFGLRFLSLRGLRLTDSTFDVIDPTTISKIRDRECHKGYGRCHGIAEAEDLQYESSDAGSDDLCHRARVAVSRPGLYNAYTAVDPKEHYR